MIKPYYEDSAVTIYHGDCREVLPEADVLITDPPYGIAMNAFSDDLEIAVEGADAASGNRAAFFMSPRRIIDFGSRLTSWKFERLLWMRKLADLAHPWRGWHMNGEAIIVASRGVADWPTPKDTREDCYDSRFSGGKNGHPAAKPLRVITDLVRRLSHSGDIILDPFMGSGTTLRAAKDLGRKAIGIEIEEKYCEIAARRMEQEVLPLNAVREPVYEQELIAV